MNRTPSPHLGMAPSAKGFGFIVALMPVQGHGRQVAARHRRCRWRASRRGQLRMRRRAFGFDGERMIQLEGPPRQVVPVAAKVGHRAVAEIPPAVPLGAGPIHFVERAEWRGAEP